MTVKKDVGMKIKMGTKCFPDIVLLDQGKPVDETPIYELCEFVNERHDCADFRLICLIKTFLAYKPLLSEGIRKEIENTILNFKYAMDEPGADSMCFWSENHQLLFASCEYLAGITFPNMIFQNDRNIGVVHAEKARKKLLRWMELRFLYGFTEWHSNTYYEEDVAPLAVLVDHANDPELETKAKMMLDLLFLDMALHSFQGAFVAASGRCYENQKKNSAEADVNDLLRYVFKNRPGEPDFHRISALFLLCKNYQVPKAIVDIIQEKKNQIIKNSMGLNLDEVKIEIPSDDYEDRGLFLWSMEAFTNQESIELTMDMFNAWKMQENVFLRDLKKVNFPFLRKAGLLPNLVKVLNPATQGVAIQRANTYTYKTEKYMLSTAQHYHPKEFGDQQHIWQATLPNAINVFSTHPGCPMFDDSARNFSPARWVGNGLNPDAAQDKNVLLLSYDLRARKGFLERKRQNYVHFYFPSDQFDEVIYQENGAFGRIKDAYIAIRSLSPVEIAQKDELIFRGKLLHFAVVVGCFDDSFTFPSFVEKVSMAPLSVQKKTLSFQYEHLYELTFNDEFKVDGEKTNLDYPRFDTPFVTADRKPSKIRVVCKAETLELDFVNGIRTEGKEASK